MTNEGLPLKDERLSEEQWIALGYRPRTVAGWWFWLWHWSPPVVWFWYRRLK